VAIPTSFLRQGRSEVALAHAGGTENKNVFVVLHPSGVLRQCTNYTLLESSFGPIVDVFHTGTSLQPISSEAPSRPLRWPPVPRLIDQQHQAVQKTHLSRGLVLFLPFERFDHPVQLQSLKFFDHRLF